MIHLTKPQRHAVKRIWLRLVEGRPFWLAEEFPTYRTFRRSIQPGPGCVMVHFAGMWLGIEPDGYTHS